MTEPTAPELVPTDDDEISLLDLLQTVVENLRLLVFAPLAAGLLALAISYFTPPTFTATTQFMPPLQQQGSAAALLQNLGALGGLAGAATGIKNTNEQFVSFLQSRSIQDALIQRFKLVERYGASNLQDARLNLAGRVRITSGKSGLVSVSVDDQDPALAAQLANAHVSELRDMLGRLALTEAQQRRVFFEKQLADAKDKLVDSEQALQATGVSLATLKADPASAVEGLAKLQASITAQEVKVASMRGYLTESAPDFRQAMTELTALRKQLTKAEQAQAPGAASSNEYIARFRNFKYNETLFELFAKQYELARVDESREAAVIQVVDVAVPPERKSKPKKAQIAVLTTLATGFALLLFVFVRQAVRNAAQDAKSAAKLSQLRQAWARALGRRGSTPS
jgi:uncharacterized protein involved in exopolysaccharide biosynthesis